MDRDATDDLIGQVQAAAAAGRALTLRGAGTKSFLGRVCERGEPLELGGHRGILDYQPKELVVTARGGTPLDEIESALADCGQQLPFEPPHFGPGATIGGTVACGLSGPARPYAGAARDLVLGASILTGRGEVLRFGGTVMKNVAGYDVSRLMAGAFGTLGVLLDLSIKVLPTPVYTQTQTLDCDLADALALATRWGGKPLPINATCWDGERLWVRLSGAEQGVLAATRTLGGEHASDATAFWDSIREHRHPFFAGETPLWRLSLPTAAPPLDLDCPQMVEWSGSQRWLRTELAPEKVRAEAQRLGGHATLFRGGDRSGEVFAPLPAPLLALHRRLKSAFDPQGILNPGRMYAGL
jgi:glycolate oxidase FAD binding subunit